MSHPIAPMIRAHTALTVQALYQPTTLGPLIEDGSLRVVGGYCALDTGAVSILD